MHGLQRRPSLTLPPDLLIRKPSKDLPSLPRRPASKARRKTVDVKIPGAYIEHGQSPDFQRKSERPARLIEVESIARDENKRKAKSPLKLPTGNFDKSYAPGPLDSSSRYRDQRLITQRSHTVASSKVSSRDSRPDSTQLMEAVKVEYVKVQPFRRLSLGEMSTGLGNLWEV